MLNIAILGRPNVGKSTLFNRLTGSKQALVANTPGLTRDRKFGQAEIGETLFQIIDTAGLERAENQSMEELMMMQTNLAMESANIILMMVDAHDGLTPDDQHFSSLVRKMNIPTILVANKGESERKIVGNVDDFYRLGFGEPVIISAEHGIGMYDLEEAIEKTIEEHGIATEMEEDEPMLGEFMQIALVGRPNVGKSTLFNKILGENRSIESDVAGTTRDSVYVDFEHQGAHIKLVDTAGLRKKSKRNKDYPEKLSVDDTYKSMRYANIVVMVVDATQAFDKVDLSIADHILSEGRGMVIAVNKWDLVKDKKLVMENIQTKIEYSLSQARTVPVVTLSAIKGKNVEKILQTALEVFEEWNMRVNTGKLNRWLEAATSKHIPPLSRGKRIKLRYITQTKSRPPTFVLFTSSNINDLPESYVRYLTNSLAEHFKFVGVPLRLLLRKTENPYEKKKK